MTASGFGADRCGWPDDALVEVLHVRGWTQSAIERLELTYDERTGEVGFPIRDELGDELGTLIYRPRPSQRLNGRRKMEAPAGVPRQLFPPPELLPDHVDELILGEGEPDVVAACSHGFVAVGVPGTAGWKPEYAARFRGPRRRHYVAFDCDKVGREAAPRVASDLVAMSVDVRVVDLDPSRHDGYDLTDFLLEHGAAGLRELMADAEPYTAASGARWTPQPWSAFRDTSPDELGYLIDGFWSEAALGFVSAPPKKGKTWIGLALALAVATGRALFGEYAVPEPRPVLYVALEGHRAGIRARIGSLARGLGLDPDGDELLHVLYRPRPFNLAEPELAAELVEAARRLDAALIVVDVLRQASRGLKESSSEDFGVIRDRLDPLLAEGRSVALLHHFGKLSELNRDRSPGERMAGSGAMYGALDVGVYITKSESGARRLRLELEARDFATPDPIGVAIVGEGNGKHGGLVYTDTASVKLDQTAADERDLGDEIEQLFADGKWRTEGEVVGKKDGIGANTDEVAAALRGAPARFVRLTGKGDGPRVGRGANAKPWGTVAMLRKLEEAESESLNQPVGRDGGDTQLSALADPSTTSQPTTPYEVEVVVGRDDDEGPVSASAPGSDDAGEDADEEGDE